MRRSVLINRTPQLCRPALSNDPFILASICRILRLRIPALCGELESVTRSQCSFLASTLNSLLSEALGTFKSELQLAEFRLLMQEFFESCFGGRDNVVPFDFN
jgi:hypothetical protein